MLAELHGDLLRRLSGVTNEDYEGLGVAARRVAHRGLIDGRMRKRIERIDMAFSVVRHLTGPKVATFWGELDAMLGEVLGKPDLDSKLGKDMVGVMGAEGEFKDKVGKAAEGKVGNVSYEGGVKRKLEDGGFEGKESNKDAEGTLGVVCKPDVENKAGMVCNVSHIGLGEQLVGEQGIGELEWKQDVKANGYKQDLEVAVAAVAGFLGNPAGILDKGSRFATHSLEVVWQRVEAIGTGLMTKDLVNLRSDLLDEGAGLEDVEYSEKLATFVRALREEQQRRRIRELVG